MEDWISKSQFRIATTQDVVLHSECAFTFHTPFTGDEGSKTTAGILVNLQTFLGTVEELAGEGLFLRIIKRRVEKNTNPMDKVITAPKTLGIGVDGGFESEDDRYEIITSYSLVARSKISEDGTIQSVEECIYDDSFKTNKQGVYPDTLFSCIESIQNHSGMALQQDLEVWKLEEEPLPISKYAYNLPIIENGKTISPNPTDWRCESSGETDNLWLNLSDGYIGGGRRNWDGTGGSNGALDHYLETGKLYPLVVKLGTITANVDDADCYSYAPDEDGPVKIPNLDDLLRKRGIHVTDMYVLTILYLHCQSEFKQCCFTIFFYDLKSFYPNPFLCSFMVGIKLPNQQRNSRLN
jgi:ubiquitin carboxyl-terminal hydrolase 5/13